MLRAKSRPFSPPTSSDTASGPDISINPPIYHRCRSWLGAYSIPELNFCCYLAPVCLSDHRRNSSPVLSTDLELFAIAKELCHLEQNPARSGTPYQLHWCWQACSSPQLSEPVLNALFARLLAGKLLFSRRLLLLQALSEYDCFFPNESLLALHTACLTLHCPASSRELGLTDLLQHARSAKL